MNYFGSTNQPLCERKSTHKSQFKNNRDCCSSKQILSVCDDWDIEVVEILPANSPKETVLIREKWWIDNNECVNIKSPVPQTQEEVREYKRIWAEKNRRAKGILPVVAGDQELLKKGRNERRNLKRLNWTDEEREAHNKKKRENRPILNEEQKEKARERAKKQRQKAKDLGVITN